MSNEKVQDKYREKLKELRREYKQIVEKWRNDKRRCRFLFLYAKR